MEGNRNIVRVRMQVPISSFEWSTNSDWRFPTSQFITLSAAGVLNVAGYPDRDGSVSINGMATEVDAGISGTMMLSYEPRLGNDSVNVYMPAEQFRALVDCRLSTRNFLAELLLTGGVDTPRHPDDNYHVYDIKMLSIKLSEVTL